MHLTIPSMHRFVFCFVSYYFDAMKISYLSRRIILTISLFVHSVILFGLQPSVVITLKPGGMVLMTDSIQKAIDKCALLGGGTVLFPEGVYLSGGLELKSYVTLQLEKGALLQGSDQYADYKNDAFIFGKDLTNITIRGQGIIDGVDCYNPNGEEGFRGPHCIRLINCKKLNIQGITIKNSANWALNFRYCDEAIIENVSIRAGHDGLHTRFCSNFKVSGCDFRTGDDAFAGNDNRDFVITDCKINTSCNGFRFGCKNFKLERCKFWGPGEYIHKIQKRSNMLSAFVHFSPKDENSKIKSGNWQISDVTIENVDHVYVYNFESGLWQTGQPVTSIQFERIKATGVLSAFNITGDSGQQFNLSVRNSSFSFREGSIYDAKTFEGAKIASPAFFYAYNFNQITLLDVTLEKKNAMPILYFNTGNKLILEQDNLITGNNSIPYAFDHVKNVKKDKLKLK